MTESKDLRNHCASCGFIVIEAVCAWCGNSTTEKAHPPASASAAHRRSRRSPLFLAVVGAAAVLSAGLTPVIAGRGGRSGGSAATGTPISATTSQQSARVATTTTFGSSTTAQEIASSSSYATTAASSTSLLVDSVTTSTTRSQPQKQPGATRATKPRSPTSTTSTEPSTTTTTARTTVPLAPSPHGKKLGTTILWQSDDKKYAVKLTVGEASGEDYIGVSSSFPTGRSLDPNCDENGPPIYELVRYRSTDQGATFETLTTYRIPSKDFGCDVSGIGLGTLYSKTNWTTPDGGPRDAPPTPFSVKFVLKKIQTGQVIETPWVLVDASALP